MPTPGCRSPSCVSTAAWSSTRPSCSSRPTCSASTSCDPWWPRPPLWAPRMPPGSPSATGGAPRTSATTGARTAGGARSSTSTSVSASSAPGRRRSSAPSTGSTTTRPEGRTATARRPARSAQRGDRGVVVGLLADGRDQLGVHDGPVGVDDHDRAGEQPGEAALLHPHAVVVAEARPERGGGHDVLDALGAAEAVQRERQVGRDADDRRVVEAGGELVEAADAGSADAGVDAGEDVEHDALAGGEGHVVAQVRAGQGVCRGRRAHGGQVADGAYAGVSEEGGGHGRI